MNTLFQYPDIYIEQCKKQNDLIVTPAFVACADIQLTELFEQKTGLKVNKKISMGWASKFGGEFFIKAGTTSSFASVIWIGHESNVVVISWASRSGKIYSTSDKDIDCSDIKFWFEGLQPLLYHQQMFPKISLPFKLKDLTFELVVTRLDINCTLGMFLGENGKETSAIFEEIDNFIAGFNEASEKKDRKDGVVHNWKHSEEPGKLIYEIDLGFSGLAFLKKLLPFLSKMNCFSKVVVE